jgi:ABC-type uncharacterized transport system permease subunit
VLSVHGVAVSVLARIGAITIGAVGGIAVGWLLWLWSREG